MRAFHFRGEIPASKSILNRILVLQSYEHSLEIDGHSNCDDVRDLRRGLVDLDDGAPVHAGSGGTTFRFLVARASRLPGRFFVTAESRLLQRPQDELIEVLAQLGARVTLSRDGATVEGDGWKRPASPLKLSLARSSQFASAILLNAWNLPFDLELAFEGEAVSTGYLDLTRRLVEEAGMKIEGTGQRWHLAPSQAITAQRLLADADVSSAFSIAALAALGGRAEILNFPLSTTVAPQPDIAFISILQKMGARCERVGPRLVVETSALKAIDVDLKNSPDLFPVLAILCAFAQGRSVLHGAPQLAFKESARITKTAELLRKLGRAVEERSDGLVIEGRTEPSAAQFEFDPDQDHRLAMAAAVAKVGGAEIKITTPDVVTKSYPEFWQVLEAGLA